MSSKKRQWFEDLFWDSVEKGINPDHDSDTADELSYYNPEIPRDFIDQHVAKRKTKTKGL